MRNRPKTDKMRRSISEHARPTIGLLIHDIAGIGGYESAIWHGVNDAAQARDANLLCFLGGMLRYSPYAEFEGQRNLVYDLVTRDNVDGLIVSGSLGNFVTEEEFESFCNRYRPLPMVGIALATGNIPSVLVDNYGGMHDAIVHLIQVHGRRRIAFIRGPENNEDAEQRYRAYVDALAEYDLPLDLDLVAPGNFAPSSGVAAIHLLVDERKADFDAVVAADDTTAIGALETLQTRGIRVPYDVAVVGFDDAEEAATTIPSLTTVRQPTYELGKRAAEILLTGKQVPEQVTVATRLIVRQSCGCLSPAIVRAAAGPATRAGETFENAFATQRGSILSEIVQVVSPYSGRDASSAHVVLGWAEHLLDAFVAELKHTEQEESSGIFLTTFDRVLRQAIMADGDVITWHEALSTLRRYALPYLVGDDKALARAEGLWQQARVTIGEIARQTQIYRRAQTKQQTETLLEISEALITSFDIAQLMTEAALQLPRLGIPSCYISLYEGKKIPPKWSRLMLAYNESGRIELGVNGRRFPTHQLVPNGILPSERRHSLMIIPLFFQEEHFGLAIFEAGPQEGSVYEALHGQLSSALKGAMTLQERRRAEEEAQRRTAQAALIYEVGHRVSSKLELEALLSEIVTAIHSTFDYYGVLLLLLDEESKRLSLQSIAGGYADTFPQDLCIDIGEGMIGYAATTGRTQISGDVSKNPHYVRKAREKTKSELAVPIKSRSKVIAVLDLQSDELDAFDETDVMAMETLADQIAIAIENARLYEAIQQELTERKRAEEQLQRYAAEMERANEEVKRFAYIVSHDLRAPLVNMKGFTSELRLTLNEIQAVIEAVLPHVDAEQKQTLTYALQEDVPEALEFIDSSVAHMDHFITALLKLSRLGHRELKLELVDTGAIVQTILATLAHQITEHKVQVVVDTLPQVIADRTSMEQIISNILGNAVKYLDPARPGKIEITAGRDDGETVFRIQDNGRGIAAEDMDKVFAPFRRAGIQDTPGEGMGLAYVQALVRRHGGRIWCDSELGTGTTFTFTISNHLQEGEAYA
jgi:DNA-binding LacI/PurR family transcriptional regulator/signal transduction histidine kinase